MTHSGTTLIRTPIIRIANYPERLGPSDEHFLTVNLLYPFMAYVFPPTVKYIQGIMY